MGEERKNIKVVVNSSQKVNSDVNVTNDYEEVAEQIKEAAQEIGRATKKAGKDISRSISRVTYSIDEIAKSNYDISQSIKQGAVKIFNGLGKISDEMERNNKVKEYYMLQKEIEEYEDWLIEHGLFKQVYDNIQIEETEELHISQEDIIFITSVFCGEDASSAIQLMAKGNESLIEYYLRNLMGKRLYLKNKQIIVDNRVLINNYEHLGEIRGDEGRNTLEFVMGNTAIKIESNVNNYFIPTAPPYLTRYITSIEEYCDKIHEFLNNQCKKQETAIVDKAVNDLYFYIVPSIRELMELLKKMNCPDIKKFADLQKTVSLIKVENALNNLRNLHEKLRLAVREHKIEAAIN